MPPKTLATLATVCSQPPRAASLLAPPSAVAVVEDAPIRSSYFCEACKREQLLHETAAVVCQRCGWRVLMKMERQAQRVFVTD